MPQHFELEEYITEESEKNLFRKVRSKTWKSGSKATDEDIRHVLMPEFVLCMFMVGSTNIFA